MAHKVSYNALEIEQPGLKKNQRIYCASVPIKDLIDLTMFKVDFWKKDKNGKTDQGYQRIVNDKHAQKISSFLTNNDKAILPTSILLSTREHIPEFSAGQIRLDNFPIYIVDGQHRIAGLRNAINNNEQKEWELATLPVIFLCGFPKFEEMIQFVELNTKQKKVETDLALQLMYDMSIGDDKWRNKYVSEGKDWKVRAIKIVNELNSKKDGFWSNAIKIAGEKRNPSTIASSNSFVSSLAPLVRGVFEYERSVNKSVEIINTFWGSLREIFSDAFLNPKEYAIQKTPGLFSLHALLQAILTKKGISFGSDHNAIKKLLIEIFDEIEDIDAEFWRSDNSTGVTMYGSMKGFRLLADKFIESLNKVA